MTEAFRQKGLAKLLLARALAHYATAGFDWAILMGRAQIYASSGFASAENVCALRADPPEERARHHPMVRPLADPARAWFADEIVVLGCPYF